MRHMKLALILVVLLALLVIACGAGDSPERAARNWIEAGMNLDGTKLAELTCDAKQEELQSATMWLSAFVVLGRGLTGGETPEVDISGLSFTTTRSDGQTADVRVTGQIRVTMLAFSQASDVDETMRMVKEGGRWKWCGP